MKKFNSFSKAKQFVALFLEGTFGEHSLVCSDFAIDMKGVRGSMIIGHEIYVGIRENGTCGYYLFRESCAKRLSEYSDPHAIIEFYYNPETKLFYVEMDKFYKH